MASFSRLQLAAALIEYDNDHDDPSNPSNVSAHNSAIFAPLRRNRRTAASRKSDYLGVALPTDTASVAGAETDVRFSRNSIQTFGKNPFGQDDEEDEDQGVEDDPLEVDLASWGLDAFMPKEKPEKKKKVKLTSSRSMSLGNYEQFGVAGAFLDEQPTASSSQITRRRSVGTPLDSQIPQIAPRRASFHVLSEPVPAQRVLDDVPPPRQTQAIPFPRSQSPALERERLRSTPSMDLLQDRPRVLSSATVLSQQQDNPFALRPPEHSRASRFDPKVIAHARTMSNATMGSRVLNDAASVLTTGDQQTRERRLSTLELLRPKVLVMPSPLQGVNPPNNATPFRDGFHLSTDGPPLPPGARASRRLSTTLPAVESMLATANPPIASNSFTPNPRLNLSLSQLTFRQLSHMGGERDVAYSDIDAGLRRATEDGVQVQEDPEPEPEVLPDIPVIVTEDVVQGRPAGKLFGKSLIDDLEMRKAQMRNKQRVFTGDQRPSMMDRQRSSTLVDPSTLQNRPVSQLDPSPGLSRRNSASAKPLLTFDSESQIQAPKISTDPRIPSSRSVFGTDKLWEREMVKLREIEAQEKVDAEKQKLLDQETEMRKDKKKNKKGRKDKANALEEPVAISDLTTTTERVSVEPPTLPVIERAIRGPPPKNEDDESEESDDSDGAADPRKADQLWHSGSEDENPERPLPMPAPRIVARTRVQEDESSEDDLPLAATISRTLQRTISQHKDASSSEDELPLSTFLRKPKPSTHSDDDEPLGLRASKLFPVGDDDDRPLALHPEQQRRSQFIMAQQQQMQQQQMMMQAAQMQNSMFFGSGSGFFGPSPMIMQPPMLAPSPPPSHDAGKFGRVDRWRRDIDPTSET